MENIKPKTVDEYIANFPNDKQNSLKEIRTLIQELLPNAAEALKWGQPAYSYTTIMVQFAGHKDHFNLYSTPSSIRALANELTEYETGKSSIQFGYDKPLPKALIKKVVLYRVKEYREQGVTWM